MSIEEVEAPPSPEAPPEPSKKEKPKTKAKDKGKDKSKAKGKTKGKKKGASGDPGGLSVASHPRAKAAVRRAKGWSGLIAFAIAGYLSLQASVPVQLVALRAIGAGAAAYVLAWACAVTVWRHLVVAEMRARAAAMVAAHAGEDGETK